MSIIRRAVLWLVEAIWGLKFEQPKSLDESKKPEKRSKSPVIEQRETREKCSRFYYCQSYADIRCIGGQCSSCCSMNCYSGGKNHCRENSLLNEKVAEIVGGKIAAKYLKSMDE